MQGSYCHQPLTAIAKLPSFACHATSPLPSQAQHAANMKFRNQIKGTYITLLHRLRAECCPCTPTAAAEGQAQGPLVTHDCCIRQCSCRLWRLRACQSSTHASNCPGSSSCRLCLRTPPHLPLLLLQCCYSHLARAYLLVQNICVQLPRQPLHTRVEHTVC